jgi:phosphoribosylanthranilate isomerase
LTEIKICGITSREDALFAAACGVEALGFIFYPPSPRHIVPAMARQIIAALPAEVVKVGVFVNQPAPAVQQIVDFCGLDLIQLHGDETPEYCRQFPRTRLIKAVFLSTIADLARLDQYRTRAILVDARTPDKYGGTGKTADWGLAARVKERYPLILSGGLNEENIAQALAMPSPAAVDINSGVESAPGRKDREKVRRILELIRGRDEKRDARAIFCKFEPEEGKT